jgi:NAD(P)-dependent dehydrogenase (short-subunit alcohol dehydrogenase family)
MRILMRMTRLQGRYALVTGAGGGLGSAIAEMFAKEGAIVGVNDVDVDAAEAVADACRRHSPESRAVVFDVSSVTAVSEAFAELESDWGVIDVLVNNAGVSATTDPSASPDMVFEPMKRPITDISDQDWDRMIGVHLSGTFYCTRAAVAMMTPRHSGSIICISSIAALVGFGPLHYSAAKGGILGLVRSMARSLGPAGIRINAICPGSIDAGMATKYPPERRYRTVDSVPLGRLGTADEIAYAALYLASDESSYTTGQWMSPNGGLVIV